MTSATIVVISNLWHACAQVYPLDAMFTDPSEVPDYIKK